MTKQARTQARSSTRSSSTRSSTSTRSTSTSVGTGADVTGLTDADRARRVFRGVTMPTVPVVTLESATTDAVLDLEFYPALPGMTALELVVDGISAEVLDGFLRAIIVNYDDFQTFAADAANGITMDLIMDLALYLLEEYTARPTEQSAGS